jgi:hypothetical protein
LGAVNDQILLQDITPHSTSSTVIFSAVIVAAGKRKIMAKTNNRIGNPEKNVKNRL